VFCEIRDYLLGWSLPLSTQRDGGYFGFGFLIHLGVP
jgi:hypothetical protein